jgi:hypothetical protein
MLDVTLYAETEVVIVIATFRKTPNKTIEEEINKGLLIFLFSLLSSVI